MALINNTDPTRLRGLNSHHAKNQASRLSATQAAQANVSSGLAPLHQNVRAAQGLLQYNLGRSPEEEALEARNATAAGLFNSFEGANPNVSNANALQSRIQGAGMISAGSQAGFDAGVDSRNQGILQAHQSLAGANQALSGGLFQNEALNLAAVQRIQGGGGGGGGGSSRGGGGGGGGGGTGRAFKADRMNRSLPSEKLDGGLYRQGNKLWDSNGKRVRGTKGLDGQVRPNKSKWGA